MAYTPLATQAQVESNLGRSLFDAAEISRCTSLILEASALIGQWTNYSFVPGAYTFSEQVADSNQVTIPADVTSTVGAVRSTNEDDGTFKLLILGTDYNYRNKKVYLLCQADRVEIDYTVTAAIPTEVSNLCAAIVARSLAGSPVGATAESVGPYHVTYSNPSGDVYLSKNNKMVLAPYKQTLPAIQLL